MLFLSIGYGNIVGKGGMIMAQIKQEKETEEQKKRSKQAVQSIEEEFSAEEMLDLEEYNKHRLIYIIFVLKYFSHPQHPMTHSQIAEKLSEKFTAIGAKNNKGKSQIPTIAKTIENQLKSYFEMKNLAKEISDEETLPFSFDIFTAIVGGTIEIKDETKRTKRFYFSPMLGESDVVAIESSIVTNRELEEEERDYLIDAVDRLIVPYPRLLRGIEIDKINGDIKEDDMERAYSLLGDAMTLKKKISGARKRMRVGKTDEKADEETNPLLSDSYLNHVHMLYTAVRNQIQIELVYGRFNMKKKSRNGLKLVLEPEEKVRALNPYAIIASRGHMYLLATNVGGDGLPYHFRIDRIVNLKLPIKYNEKKKKNIYVRREPAPDSLIEYFSDRERSFDQIRYLSDHPMMGAYSESSKKREYTLRTTGKGIILCNDFFGDRITKIKETEGEESEIYDDRNLRHEKERLYDIKVTGVYDANMILFLSHHHNLVEVIDPKSVREEVIRGLEESLERYKR